MLDQELRNKYFNDLRFHKLVDYFLSICVRGSLSSLELQQISQVAVHILREDEKQGKEITTCFGKYSQ